MESARAGSSDDVDAIVELARQAIEELRPNRGGLIWSLREAHDEPIERLIADVAGGDDAAVHLVVGTVDDIVVGYGMARLECLHDGRLVAEVTDLYVEPSARGIGVGEAMMDLLLAWATAGGAIGIDALALPGDRHTKNFFETFGLTARAIVVHRPLVRMADGDGPEEPDR